MVKLYIFFSLTHICLVSPFPCLCVAKNSFHLTQEGPRIQQRRAQWNNVTWKKLHGFGVESRSFWGNIEVNSPLRLSYFEGCVSILVMFCSYSSTRFFSCQIDLRKHHVFQGKSFQNDPKCCQVGLVKSSGVKNFTTKFPTDLQKRRRELW